jgi:mRNA-degrading endonuclease YafQ of YafQ-DinJ toxin-antitoxin module
MSYNVLYTGNFRKEAKRLAKKHVSLKNDIETLINNLEHTPAQGKPLG